MPALPGLQRPRVPLGVPVLEWSPRAESVQWTDDTLAAHPKDRVMVVTHAYLYHDSTPYDWATQGLAQEWKQNPLPGSGRDAGLAANAARPEAPHGTLVCCRVPRLASRPRVFALWLIFSGCARACGPASPGQATRDVLESAVASGQLAGGVGLVFRDGEIESFHAVGFADRETKRPMRPDALFRIASMTKPVTSVAALMLVEEGKLSLDQKLSDFVPEFERVEVLAAHGSHPLVARPISVRHLLTHTSGLSYRMAGPPRLSEAYARAGVSDGLSESPLTAGDNVRRLARAPLLHQPGAAFTYGLSTDVLGYVVELASGQPLPDFLRQRVFEPLGMRDTFFRVPTELRARLARVYAWSGQTGLRPLDDRPIEAGHLVFSPGQCVSRDNRYASGGAGLVSTAADYLRFARLLARGGELDGVRLLSPASVAAMTSNQIGEHLLPGREQFGYGVSIVDEPNDSRQPGSFGWQGFYHTRFWVDPRSALIGIFLSQQRFDAEPPRDSAEAFVQAAYEH